MRLVLVLVCACLLAAGCGGSGSRRQEATAPSIAAAKAALERYARRHYGPELVEDVLVCGSPEQGTRTCSFSFAPQPSRPTAKVCGVWTVSTDRSRRIDVAPFQGGTCFFTGGPSGEILAP
jgi:hypothetical protein